MKKKVEIMYTIKCYKLEYLEIASVYFGPEKDFYSLGKNWFSNVSIRYDRSSSGKMSKYYKIDILC